MTRPNVPVPLPVSLIADISARVSQMNAILRQAGVRPFDEPWTSDDGTRLWTDVGMTYILKHTVEGFIVQMMERNDIDELAQFNRSVEAEKFFLWLLWDSARGMTRLERTRRRWFDQGYAPGVSVTEAGHHRVLRLPNDPESECTINDDGNAIAFSHAIVMTVDELFAELSTGF